MNKQAGLTLIEVLIAAMILFMSLGLVGSIFQQNFRTQEQAVRYIATANDYASVQAQIRFLLEQGETEGDIITAAEQYSWQATIDKVAKELETINPEGFDAIGAYGYLRLYLVKVTNSRNIEFEFKQAVWSETEG